jgi:probable blue pigment (indigoidine) exporter
MSPSIARRDVGFLTLAAACWGVGTVISKRAVEEVPPFTLLAVQLAASLVVIVVLMRATGMSLLGSPRLLARLGVVNPGIAYALGLAGLTWISASLSVLLWALEPLLILLLAGLFLDEGITPRFVALSLTAATGMTLVVFDPAAGGQWPGIVLTLIGIGCCAAYTILARRFVKSSDSTAQVVLAQQSHAFGFAMVIVVAVAIAGGRVWPSSVSAPGIVSAVGSGILYYAAAYWFYLTALRSVPAALASTSFYLIPIFGVAAAGVLLGDRLDPVQWIGALIVASAVTAIVLWPNAGRETGNQALARAGARRSQARSPVRGPSTSATTNSNVSINTIDAPDARLR